MVFMPFGAQITHLTMNPSSDCSYSKINTKYEALYDEQPFRDITKYAHVPESLRCSIISRKEQAESLRGTKGSPSFRDKGSPFVTFHSENEFPRLAGIVIQPTSNIWSVVKDEHLFVSVAYYRKWIQSVVMSFDGKL